jgi:uncharacterized membrane protein YfcA
MSGGTWQFTLLGLFVGTLVGMTGMGGGSLMTPLLMLVFGFDPGRAVGTDILHGAVFKSFGAARHRMLGTVHARLALWMLAGSAPMSLVGVWLSHKLGESAEMLQTRIVAVALILGGSGFLAKTFLIRGAQPSDAPFLLQRRDRIIALTLGATGGFCCWSDLGRKRHLLRSHHAARLSSHRAEDRRDGHLSRDRASLRRWGRKYR